MARVWFRSDNTADLDTADLKVLNVATRRLVDDHNLSPTHHALSLVRQTYKRGMTPTMLIQAVNHAREAERLKRYLKWKRA